ncbi:hypothetical protein BD408DRAFT_398146 [Parasitella parasitica]|nr:hypothetical protein BD408DRAFT_398146 [Parasitella parasitica]
MHSNNSSRSYLSDQHLIFVNDNNNKDILKHLESLRTRLGFARFKLRNGWEKNSLGDVECFWKQRQRQLIKEIPIPRFTQQDIIDKRSYIPASNVRYAKSKRPKHRPRSNAQQKTYADQQKTADPQKSSSSANARNHSISSFNASYVPNDLNVEPSKVRNSLDYLSYAIAMTERGHSPTSNSQQRDNDVMSPDWSRTSQLRLSLSIPNQLVEEESKRPPVSPTSATNAAAQAMLMFVTREHDQHDH